MDREVNLSRAQGMLEAKMWATTPPHEANGGLLSGTPNLESTKKLYRHMLAKGDVAQAKALEAIVTHNLLGSGQGQAQ